MYEYSLVRLKKCSSITFNFLIFRNKTEINLIFRVEFEKCNILHCLTHGHSWNYLVGDLHELSLTNVLNFNKYVERYRVPKGKAKCIETY